MHTFFYFIDNEKYYYMVTTDKEPVQSGYKMLNVMITVQTYMVVLILRRTTAVVIAVLLASNVVSYTLCLALLC
jgi:hypothetical protein